MSSESALHLRSEQNKYLNEIQWHSKLRAVCCRSLLVLFERVIVVAVVASALEGVWVGLLETRRVLRGVGHIFQQREHFLYVETEHLTLWARWQGGQPNEVLIKPNTVCGTLGSNARVFDAVVGRLPLSGT